jgi:proton glutamate symport protein
MILAVDRLLDMLRTAVNVWGDSCGATVVARLEGEQLDQPAPNNSQAEKN